MVPGTQGGWHLPSQSLNHPDILSTPPAAYAKGDKTQLYSVGNIALPLAGQKKLSLSLVLEAGLAEQRARAPAWVAKGLMKLCGLGRRQGASAPSR